MTTTSDAPVSTGSDADKVAIAALTQRVIASWAYHDAETFASVFTEDATMILAGSYAKGRDEIRSFMESAFTGKWNGTQVTGKPIDIRFRTPDSAILLSQGGVLMPGESEVSDTNAIRASWVVVRQDGEWKLAAYQNTPRNA